MFLNLFIKSDWITAVCLLVLLLLAVVKYIFKERLVDLVSVFFAKRYFVKFGKDSSLVFNKFNSLLFPVFLLISSLFVYMFVQFYYPNNIDEEGYLLFLEILGFLGMFFLIRYLVGLLLSLLFKLNKLHHSLVFVKSTYLFATSILIFPFLIVAFYIQKFNLLFFQLTLFVLSALLIMRYVFVVKNNKNMVLSGLFYFILYLCALEIAPLLLILKLIN